MTENSEKFKITKINLALLLAIKTLIINDTS